MKTINTDKSLRRTQLLGFASIVVMLGVFGAWTAFADINGAVIAPATIVAESYSKKVQHREGGNISRILVNDGELVKAGQDLVLLDPTEAKAQLSIIDGQLSELLVKKSRLESQRDGLSDLTLPQAIKDRASEPAIAQIIGGQARLLKSIEDIAKQMPDFFIGRFDIRYESKELLKEGLNYKKPTHWWVFCLGISMLGLLSRATL